MHVRSTRRIHPARKSSADADAEKASRASGAMLFSVFGTILLEVWDRRTGAGVLPFAGIALLGVALVLSAWLCHRRYAAAQAAVPETPGRQRAGRVFHIMHARQWLLILVAGSVLANLGPGADPVGFLGIGLMLWASAAWALRRS